MLKVGHWGGGPEGHAGPQGQGYYFFHPAVHLSPSQQLCPWSSRPTSPRSCLHYTKASLTRDSRKDGGDSNINGAPTVCPTWTGQHGDCISDFLEARGGDLTISLSPGPSPMTFMEHLLCTRDYTECPFLQEREILDRGFREGESRCTFLWPLLVKFSSFNRKQSFSK